MSIDATGAPIEENRIKFQSKDQVTGIVEGRLKHRYSNGLFIQDSWEAPNEELVVKLGVAYPKDVSDVRERDNVMKFINVDDVATLRAKPTGAGSYIMDLPDRPELHGQFVDRREKIRDQLDLTMARAIYERVYDLSPVRNQLNAIIQIVRWTRRETPMSIERLDEIQRSSNTQNYVDALVALGFLRVEDGNVYHGEKIESADMNDLDRKTYEKRVVGWIIEDGYNYLRDQLELNMLKHFPMYANGYYFNALQRRKPDLWLDIENIRSTIKMEYGSDPEKTDRHVVEDKMYQLHDAEVIEKDGGEVRGHPDIYSQVSRGAPLPGGA